MEITRDLVERELRDDINSEENNYLHDNSRIWRLKLIEMKRDVEQQITMKKADFLSKIERENNIEFVKWRKAALGFKYKVEERLSELKAEFILNDGSDSVMHLLLKETEKTNLLLNKLITSIEDSIKGTSWKIFKR